ncbi:MAG: metallophosphoesterase, partial [Myxococcales bacterium]|nr:metallophosphoesterase [Myxococcales bacterium]
GAVRAEEAAADGWAAYQKFAEARSGECVGPEGTLETPLDIEVAGHRYQLLGDRLKQVDTDKDKALRIGVISATKDDREETLAAIASLIAQLKAKKIDLLLVNGDIASHEINVDEKLFPALADSGVLTLVFVGNTESCGYFNQAATKVFETNRNLINGNWVRQLELEDGVVYTLPGYHDRRFVHTGGAGHYNEDDVYAMRRRVKAGPGPKIVVSHGPPMMKGPAAIDIATGAGHVGDPQITDILKVGKVPFGIFGHILEAGGRASDLTGAKGRKPKKWAKSLYVNAGSANPDPWTMLNKRLSYGMALFVEVQGDKARYEVLRLPEP